MYLCVRVHASVWVHIRQTNGCQKTCSKCLKWRLISVTFLKCINAYFHINTMSLHERTYILMQCFTHKAIFLSTNSSKQIFLVFIETLRFWCLLIYNSIQFGITKWQIRIAFKDTRLQMRSRVHVRIDSNARFGFGLWKCSHSCALVKCLGIV